jgi:hypothetical protein
VDHAFYCARFDFLENGGALSKSAWGVAKALVFGANIDVVRMDGLPNVTLRNFSQIYAVPKARAASFEDAIRSYANFTGVVNLGGLKSWSRAGH